MGVDVKLEGMQELMDKIEAMGRKGALIQGKALKAAAEPVAEDMRKLVNVSTVEHKHIRDNIEVSRVKTKRGIKYVEVGPGKKTNWRAKFLEYGTSKMSAKPFMAPAYERNKRNIIETIKRKLKEGLGL